MKKTLQKTLAVIVLGVASMTFASSAVAQEEWPFTNGDYWEVTGIKVSDGGAFKYSTWLATEWRKQLEFAKSKGWVKDYKVLFNVHARSDEPDLYLIRVIEDVPSGEEGEKRQKEYMEWQTKSIEQMQGESGNRAEYRTIMSTSLIQELNFRD